MIMVICINMQVFASSFECSGGLIKCSSSFVNMWILVFSLLPCVCVYVLQCLNYLTLRSCLKSIIRIQGFPRQPEHFFTYPPSPFWLTYDPAQKSQFPSLLTIRFGLIRFNVFSITITRDLDLIINSLLNTDYITTFPGIGTR